MSNEIVKRNPIEISESIKEIFANPQAAEGLLATVFKGLQPVVVKTALYEAYLRGFNFNNFLDKDVYIIPFKDTYSLVTSIDYARKMGQKSGIVGCGAPIYVMDGETCISCTITVTKHSNGVLCDFSATVFFKEYNSGYNLWKTKPLTMIAKVAEMHALKKACPELSQERTLEEIEQQVPQLPELIIGSEDFAKASLAIANYPSLFEQLKKQYSISPEVEAALKNPKPLEIGSPEFIALRMNLKGSNPISLEGIRKNFKISPEVEAELLK